MMNKQHILTDDEIVDVLINYVDENIYNYAVMIDGEWGCGKTYFIKERLCGELKKHEKDKAEKQQGYKSKGIIYLSLYGVQSLEEVSKQILMESYLTKAGRAKGFLKKGTEITGKMLPVLFDILKPVTRLELESKNLLDALEGFFSLKESILIFDDLERCNCPVNEILGYINTFVEHEKMKVIIVANQKEIRKSVYLENQELKYLVAANENIKFEEDLKGKFNTYFQPVRKVETEDNAVAISTIKDRMNKLFGQDVLYEKVKEKLIGITIYYYPDLQDVFAKLIKNKEINDRLQCLLLDKLSFYEDYMVKKEHPNLRTFQFYLSKIRALYNEISKLDSVGQEQFLKYIIQYSFKVCVCYKNDTLKQSWERNEEYGFKAIGKTDIYGTDLAFRFVDEFVIKSILDEKRIKRMLELYEDEYINRKDEEVDVFKELEFKWYLSDEKTVNEKIEKVMEALKQDKFEIKDYPRIISLFVELEQIGFSDEIIEEMTTAMKCNVKNLKKRVSIGEEYSIMQEGEKKKRCKEIIADIQNEIDKYFQIYISDTMESYLYKEDSWAESLHDYVMKNMIEISNTNGFLVQYNISQLADKISVSKSYDIHAFRGCILSLYVQTSMGDALKLEREKVMELKDSIEKLDQSQFDKIKEMQIMYLISNLQKAIDAYGNN
ncbi:MAG: KAP family NTPase [Clostridiales bacterium]|nr:KAP family NTPase [Clostridiales bacterium]